jgi:hypothetical protein
MKFIPSLVEFLVPNLKLMKKSGGAILLLFLFAFTPFIKIAAQCSPPMGEICEESSVLCSLDQLNGYSCSNSSSILGCNPLCSQGGVASNTGWWGFVTQGGNATVTLTIGTCLFNQGLQFGIWGDCVCGEEIACKSVPCEPPGSIYTMVGNFQPCKLYYLWVDGCSGDICDFTITTSGGGTPSLSPLGLINNEPTKIIGPICEGICEYQFYVNGQPGNCIPFYVWTLNGQEVGVNDNDIKLDFPDQGDFQLCVTAYIGNPKSGSVCSQTSPQCATVKIRSLPDRIGIPRVLCFEQTQPDGYEWHTQRIYSSGTYRENFYLPNCCTYDSVVDFTVIDPIPAEVYYITCDYKPYVDILGKTHHPCINQQIIQLPKTSDIYHCDSSINLTAIYVDFAPTFQEQCIGGKVEILPNIEIVNPCHVGESYQFNYRWFKKNDPRKTTISTEERLLIDHVAEDYCIEVTVQVTLQSEKANCTRVFCELFNESDLASGCFILSGNTSICNDPIGVYQIDTALLQKPYTYTWMVVGGIITSNPDSSLIKVKWALNSNDTGRICIFYDTECGRSCEKCLDVFLLPAFAGKDSKKRGLITKLDAASSQNGNWKIISGPGQVVFENSNDPKSKVRVDKYGLYCFEWSIVDTNCISRDTVCIEFYKFKIVDPDYPNKIFDSYNNDSDDSNFFPIEIYTPNLIITNGNSYIVFNAELNVAFDYHWYDIYGRMINRESIQMEDQMQKVVINSPMHSGFYFLVIEVEGQSFARKVCVID